MRKSVVLVAVILIVAAAFGVFAQSHMMSTARDGVFIHVSHGSDDPHRVLMALQMAQLMSQEHDVLVYFDIKGIEVVLSDAPDLTHDGFASSHAQLGNLAMYGVTVMACPGCLKAAGKSAKDLAANVRVADKDEFFAFTNGRILSLDY